MLLDQIWMQEISQFADRNMEWEEIFPFALLGSAYAKSQVVSELAFSEYVGEAYSILRDTIEAVAHACRLLAKPDLVELWLRHQDDAAASKSWKQEFWFEKESRLFEGLPDLYSFWKFCSDFGSHANPNFVFSRLFRSDEPENELSLHFNTFRPDNLSFALTGVLLVLSKLERRIFERIESKCVWDAEFLEMRDKLSKNVPEAVRGLNLF